MARRLGPLVSIAEAECASYRRQCPAVHWSSGTGQISAASLSARVSGGSSRPDGCSADSRRASRATWPASAVTSGAVCASSAPSIYRVPARPKSCATSKSPAWAAAGGPGGAAIPVVLPTSETPTLGTVIAHIRDTADRWTVGGLNDSRSRSGQVYSRCFNWLAEPGAARTS